MGILGVMEPRQGREATWPTRGGNDTDASPTPWWQAAAANWRISSDDDPAHNLGNLVNGYNTAADALVALGYSGDRYRPKGTTLFGNSYDVPEDKRAQVWADIAEARQKNPQLFQGYPTDQNKFEEWVRARQGGRASDIDAASRGGFGSAALPGLVHGLTDIGENPEHAALFAFGGGAQSVAGMVLRQGLGNAVASGLMAPEVAATRAKMGEGYSREDFDRDLAMGFAGGAALTGAHMAIGRGIPALVKRFGGDKEAASAFADTVEPINRTPDEQAALHVVNRATEIDGASPYVDTYAGQALHRDRLQAATDQLVGAAPRPRPVIGASADVPDAASVFMSRVGRAESGNSDVARPIDKATGKPLSSALGRYQFTEGTWLHYYKQRFGKTGLSDSEILAKRTDGQMQDVLLGDAVHSYSKILHGAGEPVTPGNLYVMHFAGEAGGRALFKAARDTPAAEVMGKAAVKANPFLEKMTVGDVIAWADRKMGGRNALARGEGVAREASPVLDRDGALAAADDVGVARADADLRDIDAEAVRAGDAVDDAMAPRIDDGAAARAPEALPMLREDQFASPEEYAAAQLAANADVLGGGGAGITLPSEPVGFTTAKGSTYELHDDGTTTRFKAARDDIGHEGDSGPKDRTARTVYVDNPADAARLSAAGLQNLGPKGARVVIRDGKASLLTWNDAEGKWGVAPSGRDIPVSDRPGVGKAPLELWKPADDVAGREAYRGMHAGNEITELRQADAGGAVGSQDVAPVSAGSAADAAGETPRADGLPTSPDLADPAAERLSDPVGAGAQQQLDGLMHDLRGAIEAGDLEGLTFSTGEGEAMHSAAEILANLEADKAALDALKGCL